VVARRLAALPPRERAKTCTTGHIVTVAAVKERRSIKSCVVVGLHDGRELRRKKVEVVFGGWTIHAIVFGRKVERRMKAQEVVAILTWPGMPTRHARWRFDCRQRTGVWWRWHPAVVGGAQEYARCILHRPPWENEVS